MRIIAAALLLLTVCRLNAPAQDLPDTIAVDSTTPPTVDTVPAPPADSSRIHPDRIHPDRMNPVQPAALPAKPGHGILQAHTDTLTDSVFAWWNHPYLAVGLGWTLGKMRLFDEWATTLADTPHTPQGAPLPATFSFSEEEKPNSYSTAFPLELSFSPLHTMQGNLAIDLSAWWIRKTSRTRWTSSDSAFWNRSNVLDYLSLNSGVCWYQEIPEEYFNIDNIDRVTLLAGFGITPLALVVHTLKDSSNILDHNRTVRHRYHGMGMNWKAGLATFRTAGSGTGIEAGLCYEGSWQGRFRSDSREITWRSITPKAAQGIDPLSFTTHRFKLYIRVAFTKKQPHSTSEEQPVTDQVPDSGADLPGSGESPALPEAGDDQASEEPPALVPEQSESDADTTAHE